MNRSKNYPVILNNLKEKIRNARLHAAITVNNLLLGIYWEIGFTINQQEDEEGWGAKTVERLATDLRLEFPDMKGLSPRNLRYMRDFALAYPKFTILQQAVAKLASGKKNDAVTILQQSVAKLPWGHICILLDKLKQPEERIFYAQKSVENGWSRNILILQIQNKLYKRKGAAITNFENTLPKSQSDLAQETLKNPYLFDFLSMSEEMQEKDLEKGLILHLKKFMLELGRGFAYVGNQYNLNVKGDDYFLDLLFYNYHLHCFVVFELKVGAFKPEFAGKLNFYINTIDEQIKGENDNPTLGVLLCKTPNDTVIKFALKGINSPIGVADYELSNALPKQLRGEMPTIEELEKELQEETKKLQKPVDKKLSRLKEIVSKINTPEVEKEKDKNDIVYLFGKIIPDLKKHITATLKEVEKLFTKKEITRSINKRSFAGATTIDLEAIMDKESISDIGLSIRLEGFKKAGIRAFGIYKDLNFSLEPYKYSIGTQRDKPWIEKLYHEQWSNKELQKLSDQFCEEIVEEITYRLEKLK